MTVDTIGGIVHVTNAGRAPIGRWIEEARIQGEVMPDEADDPYTFGRIRSLSASDDGRIFVADIRDSEVRVFGPDGTFLQRIGRDGEGPGEFSYLASLYVMGDTLVTMDPGMNRLGLFDLSGAWLGHWEGTGGISGDAVTVRIVPTGPRTASVFWWDREATTNSTRLGFMSFDPSGLKVFTPRRPRNEDLQIAVVCDGDAGTIHSFRIPFAPSEIFTPGPDGRMAFAVTDRYEIAYLNSPSDTARIVRRANALAPVTDSLWNERTREFQEYLDRPGPARCEPSSMPRADVRPPIESIHFGSDGRMWVERATVEGAGWDVFGVDGRWEWALPSVERDPSVPPAFVGDRMYVVTADAFGVQGVRVYRSTGPAEAIR